MVFPHFSGKFAEAETLMQVARQMRVALQDNEREMAKRLYVGNLPYTTDDASLRQTFEQAGAVASATVVIDKMSGRSRGFGFVEMANDDEADRAIEMFNGKDMGGRALTVNEARPLTERAPRDGRSHKPRF